jgi:hypothetical protein
MNSISRRFYDELLQRLNQRTIRGNRHKVALFTPLNSDRAAQAEPTLTEMDTETTVFAFNIMFERNNSESEWRLVTPLKFTD